MKRYHFIPIAGFWTLLGALTPAQVSTFPSPPPLSTPSDRLSASTSDRLSVASDDSDPIQSPGKVSDHTSSVANTNAAPASPTAPLAAATLTSMAALDDKIPLVAGDTVSIRILEDRDDPVSRTVTDSGEIAFPYIGRIKADGQTCSKVALEAKKLLEDVYYKRATVIVGLDTDVNQDKTRAKEMAWVVGEVRQVGPQELIKAQPMTVSQIILRAGGFGEFADQRKVKVIHRATKAAADDQPPDLSQVKDAQEIDVKSVFDGKSSADPYVQSGDYIIVPKRFFNY